MAHPHSFERFEEGEDIRNYMERFQLFAVAHNISAGKQMANFLNALGPAVYGTLKNLTAPKEPKDCSFDELRTLLENHYAPHFSVVAQQVLFYKRNQQSVESASDFLCDLRRLARMCDFGSVLEDMLRHCLVCGLADKALQLKLLTEYQLPLNKAMDMCRTAQLATLVDIKSNDSVTLFWPAAH